MVEIIQGRAATYRTTFHEARNGRVYRFLPGAFDLWHNVRLHSEHDESWTLAASFRSTPHVIPGNEIELWSNDGGCWFEARIVPTREVRDFLGGIKTGRTCAVSMGFDVLGSKTSRERDRRPFMPSNCILNYIDVEVITRAIIREISVCPAGACPTAFAWLASCPSPHAQVQEAREAFAKYNRRRRAA